MTNHDMTFSSPTQVYWTCAALLGGRAIGHGDEIAEVNGWRLAAIVWRLKHYYGWPIDTDYIGPENHARYKLAVGCDRSKLRLPPSARRLAEGAA
ncbi:hypothetical protein [Haematobacter genomosp. 1]|uniref:Uncharacterized protein n=1 Tax=Haematobacter genomosp. 1 TaxID=366618 RepID=A0A212A8M5_9RHOB|nr:hypothetical protein [Haematobacter genomosp. 1]OWJ76173.1 hypothetical protein CDV49_15290 [Haematobacter genomosp. 1]